ncbi:MAG: ABC transporter permease [Kamptonema sp. SIO4C4]|nr:ABC transporter permease [Kamptonema sp. SIO4C4]
MTKAFPTASKLVTARPRKLIHLLLEISLIARRNLLLDLRNLGVIIGATGFPVFLLLVFTASFAKVVMPNGSYADYAQFLVPLVIVQGLLFSTTSIGISLHNDLESGIDRRLRSLPISQATVLTGRILSSAVRLFIQGVMITGVGYLLGFRFQNGYLTTLPFLILPVIFSASFAWFAALLAVKVKTAESVQISMIPWLLPLTFLSIGYVPKESFPDWLQGFVELNPVSTATQALRGLSSNGLVTTSVIKTLLWSFALTLVFGTWAIHAYQRKGQN